MVAVKIDKKTIPLLQKIQKYRDDLLDYTKKDNVYLFLMPTWIFKKLEYDIDQNAKNIRIKKIEYDDEDWFKAIKKYEPKLETGELKIEKFYPSAFKYMKNMDKSQIDARNKYVSLYNNIDDYLALKRDIYNNSLFHE